jgi:glycosyltransferase involved in cell wall biosynthesis
MKISVITVCFNSASTLEQTLKSVASQSHADVEHIVVDGASTDDTPAIIARNRDRLATVISEPDRGIYDAMNKGLAQATGEVICFLNADDQYTSSNVLALVASQMRQHQLDSLMGDVGFFNEKMPERITRRYRSDHFTPARLAWGWMPAHPALFLHRDVVARVGRFKTDYRIAGDFEFIVRLFHGHNVRYRHVPEILVRMRLGGASTAGLRSKLLLNKEVIRACRENGLQTNMFKLMCKYPFKLLELLH